MSGETTINQWSLSSPTLRTILNDADKRGNSNGQIGDDIREQKYINDEYEKYKQQLEKEGVTGLWSSQSCTCIDFKYKTVRQKEGMGFLLLVRV